MALDNVVTKRSIDIVGCGISCLVVKYVVVFGVRHSDEPRCRHITGKVPSNDVIIQSWFRLVWCGGFCLVI